MKTNYFTGHNQRNHKGFALLIMLLLVVVLGALVWLDPFAFSGSKGKDLPWNQVKRIVPDDKTVPSPTEQQPKFTTYMGIGAKCKENEQNRGTLEILINPQGRVRGTWSADYWPKPNLRYEVVNSRFKGNIDPARLYKDEDSEEASKLYIISRGNFLILETKKGQMRTAKGRIYVTGWVDDEYNITGKVTITSDKKTYYEYVFSGRLGNISPFLFDSLSGPGFQGMFLPKTKQ
ncbi:MAG: hypothetical protein JXB29_09730 [Sedimentisphaerales bacterium]|nr:hypothetical protein [Sedimentisphaerales bacterium]